MNKKILFSLLMFISLMNYGQNLETDTFKIQEVIVSSTLTYQATNDVPVTFLNVNKNEISIKNYGQEPSLILSNTPSITNYSDAGSGWGYSYIRLRGIDQTRINMTLNGLPLNEPEDQGCYFSNYPDFLQSVKIIQIQRGAGMTKSGISNFAGSINFESIDLKDIFDLSAGIGSFNSRRFSLGVGSEYSYLRLSSIYSDGYKNHTSNKSKSLFYSRKFNLRKNNFNFITFLGNQKNELGWLGSSKDDILIDPKYNSCSDNEHDNFYQFRTQLHHSIRLNPNLTINSALFYNHLKGWYTYQYYYDELNNSYPHTPIKDFGSIDKYNLKSNTFGFYINFIRDFNNLDIYYGINGQTYSRNHNGQTWYDVNKYKLEKFNYEYFNTGYRKEASAFFKLNFKIKNINIYQDYQFRISSFEYDGEIKMDKFVWSFFNPTIGIERKINNVILYYSIGKTHREPTRNDIFMGMDNLFDANSYVKIKPESVVDNELGIRYSNTSFSLNSNIYYMKFKNEITLNGYFGPTGLLLHSTVDKSYRTGLELFLKWNIDNFELSNNSSVSKNKIIVKNQKFDPILTPNIILNQDITYKIKKYHFTLNGRYQGKSYIDLSNEYKLNDFIYFNGSVKAAFSKFEINLFVNNLTNKRYFTNGLLSFEGEPLYFVNATRNYFITLKFLL